MGVLLQNEYFAQSGRHIAKVAYLLVDAYHEESRF
jgi:hypothetical protein